MPNLVTYEQWFYEQDKQEAQRVPYIGEPSGNVQGFSLILDLGNQLMCIQRYSYVQGVTSQTL